MGNWKCATSSGTPDGGDPADNPPTDPVLLPWSTGFENGFCDFSAARGFCYANTDASYELVSAPVRSGERAAAFSVTSDTARDGLQARCVRQGTLPADAVYGAWFYVAAFAENSDNWNLMHFHGTGPSGDHGLWDVSLGSGNGRLFLYVFDFFDGSIQRPMRSVDVPIGAWFHVEFRWLRSANADGVVALFQDGEPLVELTDVVTDDTDVGQWYVGNLADALTPPDSTVYVDDLSILSAR